MERILPLLIFILIPVLRGLNGSKKQKQEYQQKRRNVQPPLSQNKKISPSNPLKSILDELNREMKKEVFGVEKKPEEKKVAPKTDQRIDNYNTKQQENVENNLYTNADYYEEFQTKPVEVEQDKQINEFKKDVTKKIIKTKNMKKTPLEFSKNPIVQGVIFSEILGPPKSRR